MALIKCPECGNTVSDKAVSCPRCGAPIKKVSREWCLCPSCKGVVDKQLKICDKCGHKMTTQEVDAQDKTKEKKQKDESLALFIFGAAVLIIVIMVVVAKLTTTPEEKTTPQTYTSSNTDTFHPSGSGEAYAFAKDFVKDRLKSPSTAKFAPFRETKCLSLGDGRTWKIL